LYKYRLRGALATIAAALYRSGFFGSVSRESIDTSGPEDAEMPMISEAEFLALQHQCGASTPSDAMPTGVEGLLPGPSFLDHTMSRYLKRVLKQLD
jgi:hypothetical protein